MDDRQQSSSPSEEEIPITAQKVLENVENAWQNELFAPEILPHQTEMVELMLGQIAHMEENILQLDKTDFRSITHRMELGRIKYIITSYLRCRLRKLETFSKHIIQLEAERTQDERRLTEEETRFVHDFHAGVEKHFESIAFQYLPTLVTSIPRYVKENSQKHVFVRSLENGITVVDAAADEDFELTQGSQHILPYNMVSDLVISGKVQLI